MLTASLMVNDLSHTSPQPSKAAATRPASGKTDAVHLVVHSGPEAKQIFTYFPYPDIPAQYRFAKISDTGIYRLTVNPQGNVLLRPSRTGSRSGPAAWDGSRSRRTGRRPWAWTR